MADGTVPQGWVGARPAQHRLRWIGGNRTLPSDSSQTQCILPGLTRNRNGRVRRK
jgi:hypothetical protein